MSTQPLLGEPEGQPLKLQRVTSVGSLRGPPSLADRLGKYATLVWLFGPFLIGAAIGSLTPTAGEPCSGLPPAVERASTIIGWVYFAAWSISFYPQVWLNWGRKSVVGLSLDFQVLNMLGFTCYAIYNSALYWSPIVRQEYALEHGGAVPAVHANDVFFAIHAAVLTLITLVQCCVHDRGGQVPSRLSLIATGVLVALAAAYGGSVLVVGECVTDCRKGTWLSYLSWLKWLYFLSFIKLGISLVKYIPQVVLNYRRKSTVGWNIWNVLLDFEGGLLSLVQLMLDSGVTKDWSPVTGNPVKFGLGFASMFFDIIFMTQHYILYREPADGPAPPSPRYPTEAGGGDCGMATCCCIAALAADFHAGHAGHEDAAAQRGVPAAAAGGLAGSCGGCCGAQQGQGPQPGAALAAGCCCGPQCCAGAAGTAGTADELEAAEEGDIVASERAALLPTSSSASA